MEDNLPELRDIHLPDGVSAWPPAYGWWVVLLGIILLVLAVQTFLFIYRRSKKRYALKILESLSAENAVNAAREASETLRRICVYKYKEAVALSGREWVDFLNSHSNKKLEGKSAALLMDAPYMPEASKAYSADDLKGLMDFCRHWIGENL